MARLSLRRVRLETPLGIWPAVGGSVERGGEAAVTSMIVVERGKAAPRLDPRSSYWRLANGRR